MPEELHYLITRHIVDTGHAPDLEGLAAIAGVPAPEAERRLRELEAMHGVILVPNSSRIWALHPFAMSPTPHWVSNHKHGWWSNCAWCALGIAAAIGEEVEVRTSDGGEGEPLEFMTGSVEKTHPGLVMHFPYPPECWWRDNPYAPCANILFFRDEARVEDWCARHGHPKGSILGIAKGLELARAWFGDYASRGWKRKTPEQAAGIFNELELDPGFWRIPGNFR
jgi:Alkylmercury lyase